MACYAINLSTRNLSFVKEVIEEAEAIFAVSRKVEIARERKVQSIDRCIFTREN